MLFNILLNGLDGGTESTFTKSGGGTKLGGALNTSEGTSYREAWTGWKSGMERTV